jgi:hypothetical protein
MAHKKLRFEGMTRNILVQVAYIKFTPRKIEYWNDLSNGRSFYWVHTNSARDFSPKFTDRSGACEKETRGLVFRYPL